VAGVHLVLYRRSEATVKKSRKPSTAAILGAAVIAGAGLWYLTITDVIKWKKKPAKTSTTVVPQPIAVDIEAAMPKPEYVPGGWQVYDSGSRTHITQAGAWKIEWRLLLLPAPIECPDGLCPWIVVWATSTGARDWAGVVTEAEARARIEEAIQYPETTA